MNVSKYAHNFHILKLSIKSSDYEVKMASFGIIGLQLCNWNEILQNEINGTQISFEKLNFIPSFLFHEHLHYCYIYFHYSYMYNCYDYSQTLCIKCSILAFHIEI
jgi:hypothetical protein